MTFNGFSESLRAQGYPPSKYAITAALCNEADLILLAKLRDRTVDKIIQLRIKYKVNFKNMRLRRSALLRYLEDSKSYFEQVWPSITEEEFNSIVERFNEVVDYDFEEKQ